jgi:hypothetical protein
MKSVLLRSSVSLVGLVLTVACASPCPQEERDAFVAMSLSDQLEKFKEASPPNTPTTGWRTKRLECVVLSVKNEQLTRFKFDLEYDGDYQDMVEYVFHDIDSGARQGRITEKFLEAPKPVGIKVLTDVDDTLYPNLIDRRYKRKSRAKTPYPGVLAFYDALKSEPADIAAGLVVGGVTHVPVTTLSARPSPIAGHLEQASIQSVIKLTAPTASERRQLKPSALSGSTIPAVWGTIQSWVRDVTQRELKPGENSPLDLLHDELTWLEPHVARHGQEDKIGEVKAKNFGEFARAYPEYRYVFVGDSGQADALTAKLLLTEAEKSARERVVTTFIHRLGMSDNAARGASHSFKNIPSELVVKDTSEEGRGIIIFRNYIHAAVLAYKHRAKLGEDLMTADELANVTEAALTQFQEQAGDFENTDSRDALRQQYAEDAAEAERLLIAAVSDRAGAIRRLLDAHFQRTTP